MSPEQLKIQELERKVEKLMNFMLSFDNASQITPQHSDTIRTIVGATTIGGLSDVVIGSPSNGQVLKYDGVNWVNDTDAT